MRIEGLETLDYFDNLMHRERFTEQADAITFDGEVPNFSFHFLYGILFTIWQESELLSRAPKLILCSQDVCTDCIISFKK